MIRVCATSRQGTTHRELIPYVIEQPIVVPTGPIVA
jgi:hypothetical protein